MQVDINTCVQMYMTVCEKNPLQTVESSCSSQKNDFAFPKKIVFQKNKFIPGSLAWRYRRRVYCHTCMSPSPNKKKTRRRKLDSN